MIFFFLKIVILFPFVNPSDESFTQIKSRSPDCINGPKGCGTVPEQSYCAGTANGGSRISTQKHPNHYSLLAARYENCTVITSGGLEITHVNQRDIDELDTKIVNGTRIRFREPFWFLKDIEEITGYLVVLFVETQEVKLPSLKIIRGKNLYKHDGIEYSYLAGGSTVEYITMPRLRSILNGPILQEVNSKSFCYMNYKIDRSELLEGDVARWHSLNRTDNCRSNLKCHENCPVDNCYGPRDDQCQEVYRRACPGSCKSCFTDKDGRKQCCDSECAAGCRGLGPENCFACKNYLQDGVCVPECNGIEFYDQKSKTLFVRSKEERRYYYEAHCVQECPTQTVIEGKYCVVNCKEGYFRDPDDDDRTCKKCPKTGCPKTCKVESYLDYTVMQDLENCFEIQGNLEILNHAFDNEKFDMNLLKRLKSVQIITGYLNIDGAGIDNRRKPTNLSFLENLKVIEGREQHGHYSLLIKGMKQLTELGLQNLNKINSGKVGIYENPNLCMADSIPWKKKYNVEAVTMGDNAPKEVCEARNAVCHESCLSEEGCWGSLDSQCRSCKHFVLGKSCINSCRDQDNRYSPTPKVCSQCHEECLGCKGPTSMECLSCKNFKYERYLQGTLECLPECPKNTYPNGSECLPCHEHCFNEGCNGPGNKFGSGCKKCRYGFEFPSGEFQCLGGSSIKETCQGLDGFYPDISTDRAESGECKKCKPECKKCSSREECTECVNFELVAYNNVTRRIGCALECGIGNYELESKTSSNPGICQQCHPLCDQHKSCSGPLSTDCERCDKFGIKEEIVDFIKQITCVEKCPPEKPFDDEEFCYDKDIRQIRYYERIRWTITGVFILIVIVAIIACLASRCVKYRKKFQQEQMMHMPEIPEYDPNGVTRRPNMKRLIVITRDELSTSKKILGSGAFGTVYAGSYKVKDPKGKVISIPVAIKVIKVDSSEAWTSETEMIEEAKIMATLDHEHLLKLVGICFVDGIKLVTVLRPMGCLRDFLIKHTAYLSAKDLILYCYQISSAMEYLTRHRIVHCDLAARNVLMRKVNHVEVTDFGLAKMLENNGTATAGAKVPFKWVPLECLMSRGEFSEASDVWAFGVTCWEIITYGAHPYKEFKIENGKEMYQFLKNGNRLPQPANCGVQLHGTLISCWSENPSSRPKFSDLKETFVKYHRVPTEYIQDRQFTQRMDSYTGSAEQQRQQIQRLLSLTDSAMEEAGFEEHIYTDQNGFDIVFNPMTNLDSPRTPGPVTIGTQRSSTASSRYKPTPQNRSQLTTIETSLTEVDTDEENYLVPNPGEVHRKNPATDCQYTKVTAPVTGNGDFIADHEYQNEKINGPSEYLNVDETTTEEDDNAFIFPEKPEKIVKEYGNKYINQAESCL
ncbi:hypothetical protein FO519_007519 [Halicephalobus sp. NKZ332]|nr:hypothetical protein FO519_007519 [Halicephalobus sp. NKZ332]